MFHVEFLIEDKDVLKLRYALLGFKIYNYEDKPVVNAKKGMNGSIEPVTQSGKLVDRLIIRLRETHRPGSEVTAAALKDMIVELGNVPTSNYLKALVKTKVVKRNNRGVYTVLGEKK